MKRLHCSDVPRSLGLYYISIKLLSFFLDLDPGSGWTVFCQIPWIGQVIGTLFAVDPSLSLEHQILCLGS